MSNLKYKSYFQLTFCLRKVYEWSGMAARQDDYVAGAERKHQESWRKRKATIVYLYCPFVSTTTLRQTSLGLSASCCSFILHEIETLCLPSGCFKIGWRLIFAALSCSMLGLNPLSQRLNALVGCHGATMLFNLFEFHKQLK